MNSIIQGLTKAFIKTCVMGTALDDCGNHDDDSLREIGMRAGNDYVETKLRDRADTASRLLRIIEENEAKETRVEYWQAKFLGAAERFGTRVKFECQTRPGYFIRPYDHKAGDSIEKQVVEAYKNGAWEFEFLYTDHKGIAHYRITREV